MAPFKLKFRMGSSRSTSQETETEQPTTAAQQPLLGNAGTASIGASTITINSENNYSLGSIGNNDQRNLISCNSNDERTGYTNPVLQQNFSDITNTIPQSPPPSYEHVLEENRIANRDKDNNPTTSLSTSSSIGMSSYSLNNQSNNMANISELNLNDTSKQQQSDQQSQLSNESSSSSTQQSHQQQPSPPAIFLYSAMGTPSQEDLVGNIGSCDPLFSAHSEELIDIDYTAEGTDIANANCSENNDRCSSRSENEQNINSDDEDEDDDVDDTDWDSHEHQSQEMQPPDIDTIINNKSTKEIYKAVAKQWGITCKMSEQCRCIECQSHYFDCEFDENDHQKTDGGLGATTPMFISEVMHGSACNIL